MSVAPALKDDDQVLALRIARELAMDLHGVETILKTHSVDTQTWDRISSSNYFQAILREAVQEWNSALNTQERVRLKSAAMFEEWLPEANKLAHTREQPLNHKVELMKLIKSTAGVGVDVNSEGGGGERFSVTINLGADQKLTFQKDVTPKVIEETTTETT